MRGGDRKDAPASSGAAAAAAAPADSMDPVAAVADAISAIGTRVARLRSERSEGSAAAVQQSALQQIGVELDEIAVLLSDSAHDAMLSAKERERYSQLLAHVKDLRRSLQPAAAAPAPAMPELTLAPSAKHNGTANGARNGTHNGTANGSGKSNGVGSGGAIAMAALGARATDAKDVTVRVAAAEPTAARRASPIDAVNIVSALTWTWVGSLISTGRQRPLQDDDLDAQPERDQARVLLSQIESEYQRQQSAESKAAGEPCNPSVLPVIRNVFRGTILFCGLQLIMYICVAVGLCLILRELLIFVGERVDSVPEDARQPDWHGYLLAVALGGGAVLQSLVHHSYFFRAMEMGTRIRLALTALIYKKLLSLKTTSLSQTTTGQVVNLISNDAARFEDLSPFFHYMWAAPLQLAAVFGFLWRELDASSLVAVGTFILLCPLQIFFARRFGVYRKNTVGLTDERVKTMNEILTGVEVMKLYAWEQPMERVVRDVRQREFESIKRSALLKATNQGIFFISTELTCLVTFACFYFTGGQMTATRVFTTIALLNVVKLPFSNFLPFAIEKWSEVRISIDRINTFLALHELDADVNAADTNGGRDAPLPPGSIECRGVEFAWEGKAIANLPRLQNVTVSVAPGAMVAVVGGVGSFKSSLLLAWLREVPQIAGTMRLGAAVDPATGKALAPRIAYSSQKPWIFAGTVRDNIVFDRPFDADRYAAVVAACELATDLRLLQAGDQTVIGERGVNISGGQKARVALARAAYSDDCDIYLFDDPLAAVDAVVARRIFDKVIGSKGILAHKTRVLATHQTHFLPEFDTILVLDAGRLALSGTWAQLNHNPQLTMLLAGEHKSDGTGTGSPRADGKAEAKGASPGLGPVNPNGANPNPNAVTLEPAEDKNKITLEEDRTTGSVGNDVYLRFFQAAGGYALVAVMFALLVAGQVGLVACDWWLSQWTSDDNPSDSVFYTYLALVLATAVVSLGRSVGFFYLILHGATAVHNAMFKGVIYASMRFFEANPVGRVLNRFAKDQSVVDEQLPYLSYDYCQCVCLVLGSLFVVGLVNPYTLLVLVPCVPIFAYVRSSYVACSREVKRIEAISRSPVYALFSSTLHGLQIVRAYKVGGQFYERFSTALDNNTRPLFAFMTMGRWLGFRLDFVCALVVVLTALLGVAFADDIGAGSTGFALTYALQLTSLLQWAVRQSAEVENCMTSTERIQSYSSLPEEGKQVVESNRPAADWPATGEIRFDNFEMRYREGLDLVLKGVDVCIRGREKVGVCGRTGAGKSSLLQALFRLVEPAGGAIRIDGVDITSIGLYDLRSRLAIIPQNPVLFSGTLRYNLDPFGLYSDEKVWDALDAVQLKELVQSLPGKLTSPVSEYGGNFSVGQCQLLCVARALLKPSRILFVDEATANVDMHTDNLIQQILRTRFADRSVITIAHRLNTILDSDKILVMDAGRVAEFDAPQKLLANPHGIFSQMYKQSRRLSALSSEREAASPSASP